MFLIVVSPQPPPPTEEAPHMRDIVVEETMSDMDKNKDGRITLEEYISESVGCHGYLLLSQFVAGVRQYDIVPCTYGTALQKVVVVYLISFD